jgi:hypothetical protein
MLLFKRSARPRRHPSYRTYQARLGVELLESRCVPSITVSGAMALVSSSCASMAQTPCNGAQAVAMDSAGDYVAAWASNGEDGSGWGVYAERFQANGSPAGPEVRVNTTTAGDQTDPAVAMDSAGDTVITWSSYGQDGSGWGVYSQRYDAAGVAQGGETRVNTTTAGDQDGARVAMDGKGNYVVTWQSYGQDGSGWGIYAQRFNAAGVAQGSQFRVNATTTGDQEFPDVAMNAAGNFVVTWSSYGQDGSGWGVYGRRYNASGASQGGEFRVNNTTAGDQEYSAVAMDSYGDFVITWSSNGEDGSGWGVYARRYNSSGVAQGSEFLVNNYTLGDQMYSAVTMDSSGRFVITWSSYGESGCGWSVYTRQYSATGVAQGNEVLVDTCGQGMYSSVVMNGLGEAVVLWCGPTTGTNYGVFQQQFDVV